jgi:hypothetical protein
MSSSVGAAVIRELRIPSLPPSQLSRKAHLSYFYSRGGKPASGP